MRIPKTFEHSLLIAAGWAASEVMDRHCPLQKQGVPPDDWTSEEKQMFDLIAETEDAITKAIQELIADKRK